MICLYSILDRYYINIIILSVKHISCPDFDHFGHQKPQIYLSTVKIQGKFKL